MASREMVIKVVADMSAFTAQVRAGVQAVGGTATVPVGSPVGVAGAAGAVAGLPGAAGAVSPAEQAAASAALVTAEGRAAIYSAPTLAGGYAEGAASPNWSYITRQGAGVGATRPAANPGGRGGFFGAPHPGAIRALAFQSFREIGQVTTSLAEGEEQAGWASSPAEAALARANGVKAAGDGLLLGAAFAIPDLFGASWTPNAVARQAQDGVKWENWDNARRQQNYDLAGRASVRDAFGRGGESASVMARIDARNNAEIADLNDKNSKLDSIINDRTAIVTQTVSAGTGARGVTVTTGGEYVNSQDARLRAADERQRNIRTINDRTEQARFEKTEQAYTNDRFLSATQNRTSLAFSSANGMADRGQDLQQLHDAYEDKIQDAMRRGGADGPEQQAVRMEYRGTRAAKISEWARQDRIEINSLLSGAQADTFRAQNRPFDAQLSGINSATEAAVAAATEKGGAGLDTKIAAIRAAGAAKVAAATFAVGQSRESYTRELNTEGSVLRGSLNNDPLSAQIAIIEGRRDEDIANVKSDDPNASANVDRIRVHADARMALAYRDFARGTSDIDRQIQGGTERAGYAIHGGPLAGIRAQISSILESTDMDTRGLEDSGRSGEAAKRRRLGQLQLQGAQNEYFRSFGYRDANPNDVVGSGNINGVRDAFRKGKEDIANTGRHEDGGKGNDGAWTPELVQKALDYFRQIAEGGGLG